MPCVRGLRTCRRGRRVRAVAFSSLPAPRAPPHLDLEKVLGRPVDLVEALLARVGHGLRDGPVEAGRAPWRRRRRRLVAAGPPRVLLARQFGGFRLLRRLVPSPGPSRPLSLEPRLAAATVRPLSRLWPLDDAGGDGLRDGSGSGRREARAWDRGHWCGGGLKAWAGRCLDEGARGFLSRGGVGRWVAMTGRNPTCMQIYGPIWQVYNAHGTSALSMPEASRMRPGAPD